jgi:alpha-L-fucosidase
MNGRETDLEYAGDPDYRIAEGPFAPTWESLRQFQCPQWFRDAKLGFWAHWGPQAVPMYGDWYARNLYLEGSDQYRFHLRTYGHPSRFGFKDVCALWQAERFDADELVRLYREAGARYMVAMGVHHDNFDCWNSRHHRWNAVAVGPRRDIVGQWMAAAARHGLRFGVTEHLARSYSWFNTNKFADRSGPFAGVPYDGADPAHADFYFPAHGDITYAYPSNPPEWWKKQWFLRIRDLIEQYQVDFLYTDGAVPFGEVGRRLVAHLYNLSARRHQGRSEAVYTLKHFVGEHELDHGEYVDGIGVLDLERGVVAQIRDQPWQTDTCIGGWFYDRRSVYKSAAQVVHLLVDIVSKNGNLLLNFPLRPDGTLDDESRHVVGGLGRWMAVNGEAIYDSRPWTVFGEGPTSGGGRQFDEAARPWTASDFRFTSKPAGAGSRTVYAFQMAWPADRRALVESLKLDADLRVQQVRLLGFDGLVPWSQTERGLQLDLPPVAPSAPVHTFAVQVGGKER